MTRLVQQDVGVGLDDTSCRDTKLSSVEAIAEELGLRLELVEV